MSTQTWKDFVVAKIGKLTFMFLLNVEKNNKIIYVFRFYASCWTVATLYIFKSHSIEARFNRIEDTGTKTMKSQEHLI